MDLTVNPHAFNSSLFDITHCTAKYTNFLHFYFTVENRTALTFELIITFIQLSTNKDVHTLQFSSAMALYKKLQ